jgi:hypothetical protein
VPIIVGKFFIIAIGLGMFGFSSMSSIFSPKTPGIFITLAALITLSSLLGGCQTAKMTLDAPHPEFNAGPIKARGAIIFNHGRGISADRGHYALSDVSKIATPPMILKNLAEKNNWDLFMLRRPIMLDRPYENRINIVAFAEKLKKQGYQKIILAGQSAGGWGAVEASLYSDIHALIALAPATYGSNNSDMNAKVLYEYLEDMPKHTRVVLGLFEGDEWNQDDRGQKSLKILNDRNVPSIVLDRPKYIYGHGGGFSAAFDYLYRDCLADFVNAPSAKPATTCPAKEIPDDLKSADAGSDLHDRLEKDLTARYGSLTKSIKRGLSRYVRASAYKAFAIANGKGYGFYGGKSSVKEAIAQLNEGCDDRGYRCEMAILNNKVVYGDIISGDKGSSKARFLDQALGRLSAIGVVSTPTISEQIRNYIALDEVVKAAAISRDGKMFVVGGGGVRETAIEEAFGNCRKEKDQCILFLVYERLPNAPEKSMVEKAWNENELADMIFERLSILGIEGNAKVESLAADYWTTPGHKALTGNDRGQFFTDSDNNSMDKAAEVSLNRCKESGGKCYAVLKGLKMAREKY